jgi:hypothetical protein
VEEGVLGLAVQEQLFRVAFRAESNARGSKVLLDPSLGEQAMLVDDCCHKNVRFDEDLGGRDPTVALSCSESRWMTEFDSCRSGARRAKQIKLSDSPNVFDFSSRAPSYRKDPFRNCRRFQPT